MTQDLQEQNEVQTTTDRNVSALEDVRIRPVADVYRDTEAVRILMDVPGARPEDLDIEAHDGVLSVEARVSRGEEVRVYERSFRLDRRLEVESIDATLQNGVLTLRLPFHQEALPKKIEVRSR